MKGEEVVELVPNSTPTNTSNSNQNQNMFTKLNLQQQQQYYHHQQQQLHQPQQQGQPQGSDQEDESSSLVGQAQPQQISSASIIPVSHEEDYSSSQKVQKVEPLDIVGYDGGTVEVVRRPRGRPPGSKNRPKPPIIITRESDTAMRPHVLEIASGLDIVESISSFARKRNFGGLCVLNGSGAVSNVTLRQPSTSPGATVTFHGRFDILSISATYLPTTTTSTGQIMQNVDFGFGLNVSLLGPQGQIFGGSVVGGLIASGTVFVVATSFATPMYHRLPDADVPTQVAGGGVVTSSGVEESHSAAADSCGGMSMYSGHLTGSDAIWAPTPRQAGPPPPPY